MMFYSGLVSCIYLAVCVFASPAGGNLKRDASSPACSPAKASDILQFFLTNYVAFAFTVRTVPGAKLPQTARMAINAFLFPFTGILRGCNAISQAKLRADSTLDHMAKAGALCTVVRGPNWQPVAGQIIRGCRLRSTNVTSGILRFENGIENSKAEWRRRTVNRHQYERFGNVSENLEDAGYLLQLVHPDVKVDPITGSEYMYSSAASSGRIQGLVAIGQLIFAFIALYNSTRGSVMQFGYADYGSTVLQYAAMSFVNLAAQILCPSYPTLFLVRSEIMDEAERAGVTFSGVVGTIDQANDKQASFEEQSIYHDIVLGQVEKVELKENRTQTTNMNGAKYWNEGHLFIVSFSLVDVLGEPSRIGSAATPNDGTEITQSSSSLVQELEQIMEDHTAGNTISSLFHLYLKPPTEGFHLDGQEFLPSSSWLKEEWARRKADGRDWSLAASYVAKVWYCSFLLPLLSPYFRPSLKTRLVDGLRGRISGIEHVFEAPASLVFLNSPTSKFSLLTDVEEESALSRFRLRVAIGVSITGRMRASRAALWPRILAPAFGLFALCLPYVVIAAISGFQARESTLSQRAWTMAWLVGGQVLGAIIAVYQPPHALDVDQDLVAFIGISAAFAIVYGAPAIGGMVTVVQQLRQAGDCGS